VGGQVGLKDEIILSLERLNKIIKIDPIALVGTMESGCILQDVNNLLEKQELMLPIDLGAKGSCQLGGNIATNAGGFRLLRYGSLQENILGLEVVQANGNILNMMKTLHKDNAGYHLKNLFIGSEGTLGKEHVKHDI
jgi:FAD/FMN-containing dehydrogenase